MLCMYLSRVAFWILIMSVRQYKSVIENDTDSDHEMIYLLVKSERNLLCGATFAKRKDWFQQILFISNWTMWRQQSTKSVQNYEIIIVPHQARLDLAYHWQRGKNYCSLVGISCLICRALPTWLHQASTNSSFCRILLMKRIFRGKKISCMFAQQN